MVIDSQELHKRFEKEAHKLQGLELDGFVKAHLILNDYEGEILEEEYRDYQKERNRAKDMPEV